MSQCITPTQLKLQFRSLQELQSIKVRVHRFDVLKDGVPRRLNYSLKLPDLVLHKTGEGKHPIFDRDDIIVNLDFEKKIEKGDVLISPSTPHEFTSEEYQTNERTGRGVKYYNCRGSKSRKRSSSEERRRCSQERQHSNYHNKSQERRSRSPDRERHKSPLHKERREHSRSPSRYRGTAEASRGPNSIQYQIPLHFADPCAVYVPIPSYMQGLPPNIMTPRLPVSQWHPRFPPNRMGHRMHSSLRYPPTIMRSRLPIRQWPIYNNRPIPKI